MTAKFVEHRSPQTNKAKAPYNFVPLPEKVLTIEGDEKKRIEEGLNDKYCSDRHTGYIDLEITTETPLYTRCAFPPSVYDNPNNFDETGKLKVTAVRDCQDFFHRGDANIPVIPGSTLRGMTRSLVEILAYGKMNFVTDTAIIHRAVADPSSLGDKYREQMLGRNKDYPRIWLDYPSPNLRGGYLEVVNDEWFIRPAIKHENESFIHVSYESIKTALGKEPQRHKAGGYNCWVVPRKRQTKEKSDKFKLDMATTGQISFAQTEDEANGWRKAKLVVSGFMNNKKMECAVYEPDPNADLIEVKREHRLLYQEDMRLSREKKNTPRKLKDGESLFYLVNEKNELVFFGSTMMFRLPYTNTVHDLIPELLRSQEQIDLSEAIFGTIESPDKKKKFEGRQLAGRVFFCDAVCQKADDVFYQNDKQGRFVPKILSSPKPTSFQLYLVQPEPNHYEPRDAQNGQDHLKAKWYMVTEKAIKRMEMDVPKNVIDKVRKLLGREFAIDDADKADEKFIRALESNGVTRDELRKYQKNILNASAHELRTYYNKYESENGTVIRGAKRYWQKQEVRDDNSDYGFVAENNFVIVDGKGVFDKDKDGNWRESKQHTIVRPVKPQTKFVGRVYFESLNDVELGALLTALELPESKRHQIGMAKPYGLGTVKIEIKNFVLQDRKKRYKSLFDDKGFWSNPTKELSEDCKQIFESKILETYNSIAEEKVSTFHQIPRLKELFSMLEWENAGHFDQKIYANLEDDKPMWRGRYVLPYPSSIESIENTVVASSDAQSSIQSNRTIQEQQEAITRSFQHYERAIESLSEGNKELKEIAKAILKKFKDKKDLGRSLAKQLLEKIGANGLDIELIIAKEEAHKDWYLKIKQMAK